MRTRRDPDIEDEVAGYQARMGTLARILKRHTSRALDSLRGDIRDMMERGRYDPLHASVFLNTQADSSSIRRLEEIIRDAPEGMRSRAWKDVLDAVANGRLTNRKALRLLSRYTLYTAIDPIVTASARILSEVAEDGYYHATYIFQKSAGIGWGVDGLNGGRTQIIVDSVLTQSKAKRFVSVAADMADERVRYEMLKGSSPAQVVRGVDYADSATTYRAKRESRTMITQTANRGHEESYRRHKVKQYEFTTTWDERTCPVCGRLDGKTFPLDEGKVGLNMPPMHPNCRCTTVAALTPEVKALMAKQTYTDRATGQVHEVGYDMHYSEWYRTFGPGRRDGVAYVPKKRN